MSNFETDIESGSWSGSKRWAQPRCPLTRGHCAQIWFISIQLSRRSSIFSVSHIFCRQIRIQKLSTTQMPLHEGNIMSKFGSNPSNRLGGVAFFLNCGRRQMTDAAVWQYLIWPLARWAKNVKFWDRHRIRILIRIQKLSTTQMHPH